MSPPVAEKVTPPVTVGSKPKDPVKITKKLAPAPVKTDTGPLVYTPLADIPIGVERLTKAFHESQKTHSIQFRLNQLRNLYFALRDNENGFIEALEKDFYRANHETKNLEIVHSINELLHTMSSLHKWVKREPVTDLPLNQKTTPIYTERIPLGVVLIITPFNYPFFLSVGSIVGAIAGGNAVVFKPSELVPHFSQLFTDVLTKALDPDIFYAINGAIPETTAALEQKYDKIMYTGNNIVGTIIAKKAAETLTPVLLELGGKSPAILLDDIKDKDIEVIARRVVWGRFVNAGQTCIAVDYVLVHESIKPKFITAVKKVLSEEFYPNLTKDDSTYTHIIHDRAYNNLSKVIDSSKGNLVYGGERDAATRFIGPTVFDDVDWDDSTMQAELFGPILPVIEFSNLTDALATIVRRHDTPLALYVFTSGANSRKNPQVNQVFNTIRSGSALVNDVVMQAALANAPFGGIGKSGLGGGYHGVHSFRNFTHERTTMENKFFTDIALSVRYPPYKVSKDKVIEALGLPHGGRVWFNRTGDVSVGGPGRIWSFWTGVAGVSALVYYFAGAL